MNCSYTQDDDKDDKMIEKKIILLNWRRRENWSKRTTVVQNHK